MGSIGRRLQGLEEIDRKRATPEIRQAWNCLSDEECALILAPYHFNRDATPEESAAQSQARVAMPEALIACAIGYREDLSEEEVSRGLRGVSAPLLERRRGWLLAQLHRLSEKGRYEPKEEARAP